MVVKVELHLNLHRIGHEPKRLVFVVQGAKGPTKSATSEKGAEKVDPLGTDDEESTLIVLGARRSEEIRRAGLSE